MPRPRHKPRRPSPGLRTTIVIVTMTGMAGIAGIPIGITTTIGTTTTGTAGTGTTTGGSSISTGEITAIGSACQDDISPQNVGTTTANATVSTACRVCSFHTRHAS